MSQDNPIVEVPLEHLTEEKNSFEGMTGGQICYDFGWGEWGLYGIVLRVYYPSSVVSSKGRIVSPESGGVLSENPEILFEAENEAEIERADFLAKYEGYDENGDGRYLDWHRFYHRTDDSLTEIPISGHLGSAFSPPFKTTWNTHWVPDQKPGGITIAARVKLKNGMWYVTKPVEELSLERSAPIGEALQG